MAPRRERPARKRRANGEGTVFWVAPRKLWAAELTLPDGKKKRKYSKTEVQARKELRRMLTAVERGEPLGRDDLTLTRFLTEIFLPVDEKRQPLPHALMKGKPSHLARTDGIIRDHIVPSSIGGLRLSRLRPLDIQQWRDAKLVQVSPKTQKPYSPTSVRLMQVTLQGALKHAVRLEFIARNPAELVPLPAKSDFEGTAWEPDEAMRFLAACTGHRLENLFVLALLTGMREGELLGLRWADIHWDANMLMVQSNVVWVRGTAHHGTPKRERSKRPVPLVPWAVDVLRRQQARQSPERQQAATDWHDLDLVFPNNVGKPINTSTFRTRVFHPLMKAANVRAIRFQDIRGTTATLLAFLGVDEVVIQKLLGHAAVQTTQRHYIHLLDDPRVREALERLQARLATPQTAAAGAAAPEGR
ncbi:MAG TPA: site-specific integrase [Candidatus Angelobacter sp.]|nr:site-specific integrase [Candidatus Angelobacter sp.]